MKHTLYIIVLIAIPIFYGCGGSEIQRLSAENDSLRRQNETQTISLNNYLNAIETINATLDSLDIQDKLIFFSDGEQPATRDNVIANLDRFEMVILKQQQKLRDLERKFATATDSAAAAKSLISHLNRQINEKNAQIASLKKELENKDVDIARLQAQVESQNRTISSQTNKINELTTRTQKQGEALARQDAMLSNGYVLIGSKDDLKRKGVIKKGRLVSEAALDRTKFFQVDIRKWREISFRAKKPKILTNMPTTAFVITTNGNRDFTLQITNPADFWRISNYLVIQTD